jgi:AAA+ superfamily predicted ATPase
MASAGPLIVLLDEVETLAADRTKMSMEANPVDVHRATDAVLAQLDHLAANHPNLLFIATSNFKDAIDTAFISRCDLVAAIGLPDSNTCKRILMDTVTKLAGTFPSLNNLIERKELCEAAAICVGMDGRRIRKIVMTSFALDKHVAMAPGTLRAEHILEAARLAKQEFVGVVQ